MTINKKTTTKQTKNKNTIVTHVSEKMEDLSDINSNKTTVVYI